MGILYETEFDDEALSRNRDPVVPRGAVVAGEEVDGPEEYILYDSYNNTHSHPDTLEEALSEASDLIDEYGDVGFPEEIVEGGLLVFAPIYESYLHEKRTPTEDEPSDFDEIWDVRMRPVSGDQERIRALEERVSGLLEINERYAEEKNLEHEEVERLIAHKDRLVGEKAELKARLEEIRPVVRAAIEERRAFHEHRKDGATKTDRIEWQIANTFLTDRVDALSHAAREWAEREGEEETR